MVEIRRFILLLFAITAFTPQSRAQSTLGTFAERQAKQLERRKGDVAQQLARTQEAFATAPCDSLEKVIFELTKQATAIDEAIVVMSQRVEDEARAVEKLAKQEIAESPSEPNTQEEVIVSKNIEVAEVTPTDSLRNIFSVASRRYALIEDEIDALIKAYEAEHNRAKQSVVAYDSATNVKTSNEQYAIYTEAMIKACEIADEIADRSDRLINSKLGSLFAIADELGADSLRNKYAEIIDATEEVVPQKMQGAYIDFDLAMYPHRLKNTILLEQEIAATLSDERYKELTNILEEYDLLYTLLPKIKEPKRANIQFRGVEIVNNQAHKAVSALPSLKIPSDGELYSIMVANYASLPPSTAPFHNATPLYREVRGDGRTYIYVGLYPSAKSAEDDIALLREVGFKQPTLVMWRNGIRRNDFISKDEAAATKKTTAVRFRVEIRGVEEALSESALAAIKELAPRKEISKFNDNSGSIVYTVGTFTSEEEAKAISTAVTTADGSLTTSVVEFGK